MEIKGRLPYLDALRGLAIFLVVYCHIASISMGIPEGIGSTNDTVSLLHLPLFFFLSGFLMYREDRFCQPNLTWRYLGRKVLELVVPALIFVTLFALWMHRSFEDIIYSQFKGGYWFTFFLFIFIVLYALFSFLLKKFSGKNRASIILVLALGISFAPTLIDIVFPQWIETGFLQIISYQNFKYFLFYAFGAWIRSRYEDFILWADTYVGNLIIIALPFLMFFLHHFRIAHLNPLVELSFSLSAIVMLLILFRQFSEFMEQTRIGKAIAFTGRRSLDIYFLHFFILPQFREVGNYFTESGHQVFEFITISSIAILIIAVCLAFSWILRKSDTLARLFFGKADSHNYPHPIWKRKY